MVKISFLFLENKFTEIYILLHFAVKSRILNRIAEASIEKLRGVSSYCDTNYKYSRKYCRILRDIKSNAVAYSSRHSRDNHERVFVKLNHQVKQRHHKIILRTNERNFAQKIV